MTIQFFIKHYIKNKYYNKFVMLDYYRKRLVLLKYAKKYSCATFVETGTFLGETTDFFKDFFSKIYTIELQEELFTKAAEKFRNVSNISVLQGDSAQVLKEVMQGIHEKTLFWLDGHYSSSFFVGNEFIATAKGDKETPVLEELTVILKNGLNNNVILIDDARCFNGTSDYPTFEELMFFLKKAGIKNDQVSKSHDIIRIVPL